MHALLNELGGVDDALLAKLPDDLTLYERRLAAYIRALLEALDLLVVDDAETGLGATKRQRAARFAEVYRTRFPAAPMSSSTLSPPRRFGGIRKQVNMFLLTAFPGFAGLVALVAYKQGMFESQTEIHFHAGRHRINKGMAVRLHGVLVGTVNDVQLVERGVRVQLGIKNDYIQRLPRGSGAPRARGLRRCGLDPHPSRQRGRCRTPVAQGDEIRFVAQRASPTCWTRCASRRRRPCRSCAAWRRRWQIRTATSASR